MPVSLSIENAPDQLVERLRQRAKLHRRSIEGELLAIIETAILEDRQMSATEVLAEVRQLGLQTTRDARLLEVVIEQIRTWPDERQREVAQVLLAYLDEQNSDLCLSPEQIAEIEQRAADDGPYATDEEVREVFARLTK
jgi:antitoxin FitA